MYIALDGGCDWHGLHDSPNWRWRHMAGITSTIPSCIPYHVPSLDPISQILNVIAGGEHSAYTEKLHNCNFIVLVMFISVIKWYHLKSIIQAFEFQYFGIAKLWSLKHNYINTKSHPVNLYECSFSHHSLTFKSQFLKNQHFSFRISH